MLDDSHVNVAMVGLAQPIVDRQHIHRLAVATVDESNVAVPLASHEKTLGPADVAAAVAAVGPWPDAATPLVLLSPFTAATIPASIEAFNGEVSILPKACLQKR